MNKNEIGKLQPVEITQEMRKSYLDYAMSVIVARALPDVRDGLKPVHRRILYSMYQMGLSHNSRYSKSAKVVGETMGKYHPHGDMAIYDSLVRLAQDFSMRYPLVDGQGNFGSVDGDSAAAMRYCVTHNSLVITDKGLERIKNLKKRNPHIKVLSFDNKVNIATRWFDSGTHPTITIKTHRGFELCGTFNHPIVVFTKSENKKPSFKWKLLANIKKGDFAVINRSPVLFPSKNPKLVNYYPKIKNNRVKKYRLPQRLTKELAFLLGALLAEGNISQQQIGFCNNNQHFLKKFKICFKKVFPECRLHEYRRKPQGWTKKEYFSLEIHSNWIIQFLKNLGLIPERAAFKKIPEIIFLATKKTLASFLRGYAEGDGTVYLSGAPEVCFISKSETLMKELQLILLRFGLDSSYRFQPSKKIFKLLIRGYTNLNRFRREINFQTPKKRQKLSQICQMNKNGQAMSKTDYIPHLARYLRQQNKYVNSKEWLKKHNLDRYPKIKKYWKKLKEILDKEDRKFIKNLLEKEYLFDKITKITPSGEKQVYSLRVDSPCHSFVTNGFISHNTEVRLEKITQEIITDIDKGTVDFIDNFDGSLKEPVFLPAKIPNLLLMGSDGIAVGMATKIPPHNLGEVIDALTFMLEKGKIIFPSEENKADIISDKESKEFEIKKIKLDEDQNQRALEASFESDVNIDEDLMKFIKGPDFPTGATIYNKKDIFQAYATGNGKILIRAKAEIEETKGEKFRIVISEIPYQVNKANLVAKIAQLVKERKIDGITDLRDESDRQGLRVVIDLKKTAKPKTILNNLYKNTQMQISYPVNMVTLVDGIPMTLNLKQILSEFIKHRQKVVTKRTIFNLNEAKKQAHILEGLKIAVDNIDAVIATIKKSKDTQEAKINLMTKFKLSEIQANAILEMQLRRLAALERKKIEDEYKELMKKIEYLVGLLATPKKILNVIEKELLEIKEKYADPRKTKVYAQALENFNEEDLIPQENCLITLTKGGYVKRLPVGTYRSQKRGGKGVSGMATKAEDEVSNLLTAQTHDAILFFTNKGRVFSIRVWELPECSRQSKGQALVNLINIAQDEKIQSVLTLNPQAHQNKDEFLIMVTKKGIVKKTRLGAFANIRTSGLIAIKLNKSDELCWIKLTREGNHVLLVSHQGKSIRFKEKDVRPTGRDTMGVRGIRLKKDDYVVGMEVFPPILEPTKDKRRKTFRDILVVMENGLGKRTSLSEYRLQKRGGIGIRAAHITTKTGKIVACRMIDQNLKQVILTSKKAQVIKLPVKNVPRLGRDTQGVIFMRFNKPGDTVAAVTCLE